MFDFLYFIEFCGDKGIGFRGWRGVELGLGWGGWFWYLFCSFELFRVRDVLGGFGRWWRWSRKV